MHSLSPSTLRQWLDDQHPFLLLDCRETFEHDYARIDGCQLLPMSEIADRLEELNDHRVNPIVVYCHHGVRSRQVAYWLAVNGFTQVYNLEGGIDRWSLEVDPQVPRY
jgi:rhodanese-related sulfurtransferase